MREECDFPYTFPNQVVKSANHKVKVGNCEDGPLNMRPVRAWHKPARKTKSRLVGYDLRWQLHMHVRVCTTRDVYVVVAAIRTGACQDDVNHAVPGKAPLVAKRWATGPFLRIFVLGRQGFGFQLSILTLECSLFCRCNLGLLGGKICCREVLRGPTLFRQQCG